MKNIKFYLQESISSNDKYFVYEIKKESQIKIFDNGTFYGWDEYTKYKDNVYRVVNNEYYFESISNGKTRCIYKPGIYKFIIEDIDKVVDCGRMFINCKQLIEVPLFNTNNVYNMGSMFYGCENLKHVPKFDTSKVEYMEGMFEKCKNLQEVPLFENMDNVSTMNNMFVGCDKLNNETKQQWSQVYDFNANRMK